MENKVVNLKVNLGSSEEDLKKLGVAFKTVDKEATNLDATFEEIYGDLKPLTARMGEQEDRLYELAKAGKQSSQEYKDLLKSVGEYKRVQQQTDLVVDASAQTLGTKLSGSLNAVAGGFSLAQGAVGLFGTESENVEKAILKVQSAMAISQGFETINQGAKSVKALGETIKATTVFQKLQTAATAAQTFVTNGATLATKALRGALVATGIGALVVGVGLLIANFDKVKKVILNLIPGLSQVGDFIGSIVNSVTDFVGATSDASRALDRLKANADKTLSVNKKFLQEHSDQIDEYTKKKIDAKNAYSEAVKEEGADQIALAKKLNRELAAIEYSRGDEKRKIQKENDDKLKTDKKAKAEKDRADRETETQKLKDEKLAEEMQSAKDALTIQKALQESQETPIQKEQREYLEKKSVLEANNLDTELLTKVHNDVINKLNIDSYLADFEATKKKTENEKEQSEARKKITEAEYAFKIGQAREASAVLGQLSELAGKETATGKALGIASATINTYVGVSEALKQKSTLPSPFDVVAKVANVATVLATGFKAVKAITSVKVPGGGGGGSISSPMSVPSAAVPSAPSFNVVGASSTNQLAQSLGEKQNTPIKAYVVSNDISTQQGLDRAIVKTATL